MEIHLLEGHLLSLAGLVDSTNMENAASSMFSMFNRYPPRTRCLPGELERPQAKHTLVGPVEQTVDQEHRVCNDG